MLFNRFVWVIASAVLSAGVHAAESPGAGAVTDNIADCEVTATRAYDGKPDKISGFRLVRVIK